MFDLNTLVTYAGWGFLAIFVAVIFVLGFMLFKDRSVDEDAKKALKADKEDKKANKQFIKQNVNEKTRSAKKAKRDLNEENNDGLLATDKIKPSAFAVEGQHTAEEINNNLSDLNGSHTTNRFRDKADERFAPAPAKAQAAPAVEKPVMSPAPTVAVSTGNNPVTGGLPPVPQRPSRLPSSQPSTQAGPPQIGAQTLPPKLFVSKEKS